MASPHDQAYEAGRAGRPFPKELLRANASDPSIYERWLEGRGSTDDPQTEASPPPRPEAAPAGPVPPRSAPPSAPPVGRRVATATIAGLILGAMAAAIVVNIADYGLQGPWYWFEAKFLDRVDPAVSHQPTTVSPATTGPFQAVIAA